jgi:hypothetical protein
MPIPVPVSPVAAVQYGCGIAIAQTAGTPGAPFVQAGCNQALAAVQAAPAPDLNHTPARIDAAENNIAVLECTGQAVDRSTRAAWHSLDLEE